jgi:hypothetical protein
MRVTKPVKLGNSSIHQVIHTSNRHAGMGARPHFSRNRTTVELEGNDMMDGVEEKRASPH